jgi:parvulin-like peptidyl-prolyl isomerase
MFEDMITEDRLKEQIIRNEIDTAIHITEAEVEEYYNENLDQFPLRPAMDEVGIISRRVKVSEITRREAMDTMQQVLEQVREGKDFAELAKQYSEGPAAKSGGDLGFFGRGMMIAEIEDVAFNLMPGQVSEVIQGPQGLYIVKVEEKRDDEVRARLIMKKLIPATATTRPSASS